MYLSRLILNSRSRAVRRDLADCQGLHRTVMSGFPEVDGEGEARARLGVLYRVDVEPRRGVPTLLVQSGARPDWSRLAPGYLLETSGEPENPSAKEVSEAFAGLRAGSVLAFRLRANPTRRIANEASGGAAWKGKRVELRDERARLEWLERKARDGGFEVVSVRTQGVQAGGARVADVRTIEEAKQIGRRSGRLTFGSALFDGHLRIVDAEQFRRTIEQGIGSGKAYGFGLLSLARPRG